MIHAPGYNYPTPEAIKQMGKDGWGLINNFLPKNILESITRKMDWIYPKGQMERSFWGWGNVWK